MSISYTEITYIKNGQAINAANLNAPSQGLEARTVEVKRDSDQDEFSQTYTTDCEVLLVSANSAQASLKIKSQLKEDGSDDSNLVKYYLPELTNLDFSIYSKSAQGGRYIIPGSKVASLFSDSINGDSSVLATALSVPGDGVYAKIPLRHTGASDNLTSYPDLIYPKTKAQSLGTTYVTDQLVNTSQIPELVKLPELVLLDVLSNSVGENVSSFLTRLTTQFSSDISSATVGADGALSIVGSAANGNAALTLKIEGLQEGSECLVSHILEREDDLPGVIIRVTRASSPIYAEHNNRISVVNLKTAIYNGSTKLGSSSATPFSAGSYSGYFVLPRSLDPDYSYVPLLKLTEHSLLIADKVVSLSTKSLSNGVEINVHGDPIYGVPPELSSEGTAEYEIDILRDGRVDLEYKRKYAIDLGEHVTDGSFIDTVIPTSLLPDVVYLKDTLVAGDKVLLRGAKVLVTQDFVSTVGTTPWQLEVILTIDSSEISSSITHPTALAIGDELHFTFGSSIILAASVTSMKLRVTVKDNGNDVMTAGAITGTIELEVV